MEGIHRIRFGFALTSLAVLRTAEFAARGGLDFCILIDGHLLQVVRRKNGHGVWLPSYLGVFSCHLPQKMLDNSLLTPVGIAGFLTLLVFMIPRNVHPDQRFSRKPGWCNKGIAMVVEKDALLIDCPIAHRTLVKDCRIEVANHRRHPILFCQQAYGSADGLILSNALELPTPFKDTFKAGEPALCIIRKGLGPVRIGIKFFLEPLDVNEPSIARFATEFIKDADDATRSIRSSELIETSRELVIEKGAQLLVITKQQPAVTGLKRQRQVKPVSFACLLDDRPVERVRPFGQFFKVAGTGGAVDNTCAAPRQINERI